MLVFPPSSVCLDKATGASSASMMSSTNRILSALPNSSSLRRASNSALVLTVYETVASLLLVKVFKSSVYSLQRKLTVRHERPALEVGMGGGLPVSDVVILPMHTPDEPLDGIPAVVQDEDDRSQLIGDHRGQFLDSELPERKSQHTI